MTAQIKKPSRVTLESVLHDITLPADTVTPLGPLTPLNCRPFTVRKSRPLSVLKVETERVLSRNT